MTAEAPTTPFYYYDIPALTGIKFPPASFFAKAQSKLPTLAGMKFSNPDMIDYQGALHCDGGKWDLPFGVDEVMLSALAMGARGFVGSTYNFAGRFHVPVIYGNVVCRRYPMTLFVAAGAAIATFVLDVLVSFLSVLMLLLLFQG
jgi:hypothetical protein